ncbi:TPA: LPXTG cell wall anchor domain-containing protein [Streptococcus suis]
MNSDYKPALDPSTVEITKHGEGVVAEVQLGGKDGEFYLYAKGTGVTTELPTSEGAVETAKGEGAKIEELLAATIGKDELGEYLFSKGASVTAAALPIIAPATVKATETKAAEKKATSTASEKLPETGEVMTVLSLVGGLGLLGSAAMLKKRK